MIIHNVEQGSEAWLALRELKLTGSKGQEIGNNGKGLETLVKKLVLDKIAPPEDRFYGKDMQRGHELEPIAILKYEFEKGVTVNSVGFIEHCEHSGYSPDGLVDEDYKGEGKGLIEVKARNNDIHLQLILDDKIDSKTLWQMNYGMYVAKRKWCDFISYNPNFKGKSLYVQRVYPDPVKQGKIEIGIKSGKEKLVSMLNNPKIKELL